MRAMILHAETLIELFRLKKQDSSKLSCFIYFHLEMFAFLFRFFCSKDTFNTSIETIIIDIPPISAKYRFELFLLNPVGGSILTLCELSASISIGVTTSTGL